MIPIISSHYQLLQNVKYIIPSMVENQTQTVHNTKIQSQ